MLRWQTAGESHGEALVAMIEGLPAASTSLLRISSAHWHADVSDMAVVRA